MGSVRTLHANHQGSIIGIANAGGQSEAVLRYDPYGIPDSGNVGRFQYTGQIWLAELGLYHYKARAYSPTLGRFLQTDPIRYDDQINLYAYVGNDPLNGRAPAGTSCVQNGDTGKHECKVDDVRSFRKAGYTTAQIRGVERTLTREVDRLFGHPNAKQTVTVQGKSMTISSGQIANALAGAHVRYTSNQAAFGPAIGGPLVGMKNFGEISRDRDGAASREQQLATGSRHMLNIHGDAMNPGHNNGRTMIHEGMHFLPQNSVFLETQGFNRSHGAEFNRAAAFFQSFPE